MIKSCRHFPLGRVCATPGAMAALKESGEKPLDFLARHARGDWGELDTDDWNSNDDSLTQGFRLLSAYRTKSGTSLWVITEADRSLTTLLLPEEY
jgi:hypothetical protein